ncbi:hypothetical protein BLX24_26240 [Arsenicibacter rosenii]|uniref:DUF4249 domain-containing protein n=1 Tax=Arsenicibacter rosenii TaxID=1750698 RepID=A0A1S2VBT4_9BACT|nr:hypothetical protein BLX24_26240 [Arsenicibacter rosenii]
MDQQTSKLVVTGFLSPQDSVLTVKVSRSAPLGGTFNGSILTNATVMLSDGKTSAKLTYNSKEMYYELSARKLPVKAGSTYTVTVTSTEGQRVQSTCTIPQPVALSAVQLDSAASGGQKQYMVRYQWQDAGDQPHYYLTAGAFQYIKSTASATSWESVPVQFGTQASPADLLSGQTGKVAAMQSADGLISTEPAQTGSGEMNTFSKAFRQAQLTAVLLHIDETYYRFQKAVNLAAATSGNPFAEPVSIPSNIDGGLGCFAGYNRATVRVKLK